MQERESENFLDLIELFFPRLAVGVSQHGTLEEKLKMAFDIYGKSLFDSIDRRIYFFLSFYLDQNKDGEINRKDMIKIIEAMYDLANEEDRSGDKSPDKRVDLIMERLKKEKDSKRSTRFFLPRFEIDCFLYS